MEPFVSLPPCLWCFPSLRTPNCHRDTLRSSYSWTHRTNTAYRLQADQTVQRTADTCEADSCRFCKAPRTATIRARRYVLPGSASRIPVFRTYVYSDNNKLLGDITFFCSYRYESIIGKYRKLNKIFFEKWKYDTVNCCSSHVYIRKEYNVIIIKILNIRIFHFIYSFADVLINAHRISGAASLSIVNCHYAYYYYVVSTRYVPWITMMSLHSYPIMAPLERDRRSLQATAICLCFIIV